MSDPARDAEWQASEHPLERGPGWVARATTPRAPDKEQLGRAGFIFAIGAAIAAVRVLNEARLEQTSVLFIGIPTLLSMSLVLLNRSETPGGALFKGTTIALLLSMPLAGEGFLCCLMAAPLFYFVALFTAICWAMVEGASKRDERGRKRTLFCAGALPLLLLSAEGARPEWSFSRAETVIVERVVEAPPWAVARSLRGVPRVATPMHWSAVLGFPRPAEARATGDAVGDWVVVRTSGGEGKPGDLVMAITERAPGRLRFRAERDTTHYAHWMEWKRTTFEWSAAPAGRTRVRCTIEYDRRLDPAWYFGPWQRWGAGKAAEWLIAAYATPADPGAAR